MLHKIKDVGSRTVPRSPTPPPVLWYYAPTRISMQSWSSPLYPVRLKLSNTMARKPTAWEPAPTSFTPHNPPLLSLMLIPPSYPHLSCRRE